MSTVASVKEIERLVVVIDIHAWLSYPHPSDLSLILQQTVKKFLLSVSPFCRWGFKLFDSSLSPFSSRCKIKKLLGNWAICTRFDSVLPGGDNSPSLPEVLSQFCSALNCLHTELQKNSSNNKVIDSQQKDSEEVSKACNVASSLLELLVDCVWNPFLHSFEDVPASSETSSTESDSMAVMQSNSNLIIYMSTLPSTPVDLNHFLGLKSSSQEADHLSSFSSIFKKVRDSFTSNNIHLCWVDIPMNISTTDNPQGISCFESNHCKSKLSTLLDHFGWSFTFLDVLFPGLRLLPFSILWNGLAHPWFHYCTKQVSVGPYKLCMQVRDVKNKPIDTTLCKIECILMGGKQLEKKLYRSVLRISSTICKNLLHFAPKSALSQAIIKPYVAEKAMFDSFESMLKDENDRDALGDNILKKLQKEGCFFEAGKPIWQLFLMYLAREQRVAIVDLRVNGTLYFATIEPLTLHLGLLQVFEMKRAFDSLGCLSKDESRIRQEKILFAINDGEDSRPDSEFNSAISVDIPSQETGKVMNCEATSQITTVKIRSIAKRKPFTPLGHCSQEQDVSECSSARKRVRPSCPVRTDETSHPMTLEDLYLKSNKRSKILKAFSCWIKQSKETLNMGSSFDLKICDKISVEDADCNKLLIEDGNCNQLALENVKCDQLLIENGHCNELCMEDFKYIKLSSAITDQLEGEQSLFCIKMKNDENDPNVCEHFDKGADVNNRFEIKKENNSLDCAVLLESQDIEDKVKPSSLEEGPQNHNLDLDEASSYIASLEQKIADCLYSTEIDLHCFCQRVVEDAYNAFSVVLGKDSGSVTMGKELVSKARIAERLNQSLLQNPKRLASKYKKCRPPRSDSQESISELDDGHYAYTSEEKLREFELQILFRMEIIALIVEAPEMNELVQSLVDGICRLLENIQFNLPGGVLEGETLFDFSNNAIKERYCERLPSIVDNIYMVMEFNGHDDLPESEDFDVAKNTSDLIPLGNDAFVPVGTEEDSNSDSHYDSCFQGRMLKNHSTEISLQRRALFKGNHRAVSGLNLAEQELRLAEAKRERSKRFSHFASSSRDLLRVTVVPRNTVSGKKQIKLNSKAVKSQRSKKGCDKDQVILQTPFLSEKKSGSQRHHRSNKEVFDETEVILQTPFQTSAKSLLSMHQTSSATVKKKLLV